MFYVPEILTQKGPLAIVWLAAHCDKKLTKYQIVSSNVDDLICIITSSNMKISLRTTCDLIIGLSKLVKLKSKFFYIESNRTTTAIHMMAGQISGRAKTKSRQRVINLPDDQFSIDLNLPEIYEFIDMNLPAPSTLFPQSSVPLERSVSRGSITMQEIPPLTEDELRLEQEIHDRLYGDVNSVDFNEFFDDVLPSPRPQQQSPPIPIASPSSPELMPPPSTIPMEIESSHVDAQQMADDHTMTGIVTPPLPFFQPSPPQAIEKTAENGRTKRPKPEQNLSSTIEKRRRTDTIRSDRDHLGSLELPVLDDSSIRHKPRARPIRTRRFRLINDYNNMISDNTIRQNMLESYNCLNTLSNVFIPRKKLFDTCADLFNRPERSLAKGFAFHFQNACLNSQPEPEILTTTIERINGDDQVTDIEMSSHLNEDFFQETLPGPPLPSIEELPPQLSPLPSIHGDDHVPPQIDYDHGEIPLARGEHTVTDNYSMPMPSIPEFSTTDRTIIDEKFNETLDDLFATSADNLQFDQLRIYDNRKRTALLYFYNLLLMKNRELIDMEQESSLEQFNPIYIYRINRSEAI